VQGQLRNEALSFLVETQCAHCGRPFSIEIDSRMQYRVFEAEAQPILFIPHVDFAHLKDPSIIDAF